MAVNSTEPNAVYDRIGTGYARYRRPDPRIAARIEAALGPARSVLNVGAGTGSYEPSDRCVLAVEPSRAMIRQRPAGAAPCLRAGIESLAFEDGAFDAAMAVLTVHHWPEARAGVAKLGRTSRGVVVFTFDANLHNTFWLFHDYIPAIVDLPSTSGALPVEAIAEILDADRIEDVPVPHDCVDGFGWAYWRRPEAYLDPRVRACISGFGLIEEDDVARGLARLEADLASGRWHDRYRPLLARDSIDGGFRLVIRDMK